MNIIKPHERRPAYDNKDAIEVATAITKLNERIEMTRQGESVFVTHIFSSLSKEQRKRLSEMLLAAGWFVTHHMGTDEWTLRGGSQ